MSEHLPDRTPTDTDTDTDIDTALTPPIPATVTALQLAAASQAPAEPPLASPAVPVAHPSPAAVSVSRPESSAAIIASLRNVALEDVEATLVATREAYRRGEVAAIEGALLDQFCLLQTLALKLLRLSGTAKSLPHIQLYGNLGLRAVDSARRSLEALRRLIPPPGRSDEPQTK